MAHPIYNATFCKLGHKIISDLIDESPHHRCTKEEVAEALNAALNLDPVKDWSAVTKEVVETALRSGAFDSSTRAFGDYKGRYGGIREAELGAADKPLDEGTKAEAKPKTRKPRPAPVEAEAATEAA